MAGKKSKLDKIQERAGRIRDILQDQDLSLAEYDELLDVVGGDIAGFQDCRREEQKEEAEG